MKHHRRKPFSYVFFLVLIIMITVSSCSPSVKDTVDNDSSRQTAKTKTPLNSIDSSTSKEAKVNKGKEILVNPADGAEMILIPAGEFTMGASDSDKKAQEQEKPAHKVYLDAYYIYKYEVTNNQFRKFALETGYKAEGNWEKWVTSGTGDYPAIMVSWNDAAAYCKWAGVKLPTEAQWEKAARGNDDRIYPWGNNWDPSLCGNKKTPLKLIEGKARYLFEKTGILPVGFFAGGVSPYGVMDMSGNVREWCSDWFKEDYYSNSPVKNPLGPDEGEDKVLKGGSFFGEISSCRITAREDNEASSNDTDYGFRCVWEPGMPFPSPVNKAVPVKTEKKAGQSLPPESTPASPDISRLKKEKKNSKDGAEMILIPGGEFMMGASPGDSDAGWEEKPLHRVFLNPFYIYKYEVTFGQFALFIKETGFKSKGGWEKYFKKGTENLPVVYVTWDDAAAYSRWAGGNLPTEAQWELAARGKDGRIFPWGNDWNPDISNNFELKDNAMLKKRHIIYDNMGITPVGSFPNDKSPYGVMDMGGNVIEWCRDFYNPKYYEISSYENPLCVEGTQRVMRGGGWGQPRQVCRSGYRDRERPEDVDGDFGFRCVVEIEGESKNLSK